jgi:hypothetical protein
MKPTIGVVIGGVTPRASEVDIDRAGISEAITESTDVKADAPTSKPADRRRDRRVNSMAPVLDELLCG